MQGNLFHAKNKASAKYTHNGGEIKGIQTLAGNRVTFHDKKGAEKIVISNGNQKGTALEIGFTGDGNITLKTKGSISLAAGQDVLIEAGNDVKISAKKNVVVTAKEENINLTAKKDFAVQAQQNIALAAKAAVTVDAPKEVTVASKTKLNLHGGGEIALKAATIGKSVG